MARKSLDIIARVVDAASAKLKVIQKNLLGTGAAANQSAKGFKEFNRLLFTTTAFISTFKRAFQGIGEVVEHGAEVGRVTDQFERILGPKSRLFQLIDEFTDNSIDRFEAMKAGIELGSLGIATSVEQVASLTARAGTAAKLAGKQSAEGIEEFTAFMKDGSVTHLEFLNLIAKTNPALQAQLAVLKQAGGVMGTVLDTQMKLTLGTNLLRAATNGHLKGERDLLDVILDVKQAFFFLRTEIGQFIGGALVPVAEKLKTFLFNVAAGLENIRKNHKTLYEFSKALILASGSVMLLVGALGALRLIALTLSALGLGLPGLVAALAGLTLGFLSTNEAVEKVTSVLKSFWNVSKGVFQLVSSFLGDSKNFSDGVGMMDKSLYDFLEKKGLLELTKSIARVIAIAGALARVVVSVLRVAFKLLEQSIEELIKTGVKLYNIFAKIFGLSKINLSTSNMARGFLDSTKDISEALDKYGDKIGTPQQTGILDLLPKFAPGSAAMVPEGPARPAPYEADMMGSFVQMAKMVGPFLDKISDKVSSYGADIIAPPETMEEKIYRLGTTRNVYQEAQDKRFSDRIKQLSTINLGAAPEGGLEASDLYDAHKNAIDSSVVMNKIANSLSQKKPNSRLRRE